MTSSPEPAGRRLVVVSGIPGSGKSTIARRLGEVLGLPVFDKDDILEAQFGPGPVTADERSRSSRLADDVVRTAVETELQAIVVSFWRRPELSTTSGTPTEWLASNADVKEVWCVCDPAVAKDRFLARHRHPGHDDDRKDPAEVLATFEQLHRLGPLGVGPVIEVRTDGPVDIDDVVRRLGAG